METAAIYFLIILFIFLNIVDLFQTRTLLCYYGPEAEANFIIRRFYAWSGFGGVVVYKMILTAFVVWMVLLGQSIWLIGLLTAFYGFVVVHNRSALLEGEKEK